MMCREQLQLSMGNQKRPSYFSSLMNRFVNVLDYLWNPLNIGKFSTQQCQLLSKSQSDIYDLDKVMADLILEGESMKPGLFGLWNLQPKQNLYSECLRQNYVPSQFNIQSNFCAAQNSWHPTDCRSSKLNPLICTQLMPMVIPHTVMSDITVINLLNVPAMGDSICVEESTMRIRPQGAVNSSMMQKLSSKMCRASIPPTAVVKVNVLELQNQSEVILNQELVNRKNRKMSKLSKKKRRRLKKQQKVGNAASSENCAESLNSRSPGCSEGTEKLTTISGLNEYSSGKEDCELLKGKSKKRSPNRCSISGSVLVDVQCKSVDTLKPWCTNPEISFILGSSALDENDDDLDFDDCNIPNTSLSFVNCFVSGLTSLGIRTSPSINNGTSCSFSIEVEEISPELRLVNKRWNKMTRSVDVNGKRNPKVKFANDTELTTVFPVDVYDRKGEWELFALERCRFKRRIEEAERTLAKVLSPKHRQMIHSRLNSQA